MPARKRSAEQKRRQQSVGNRKTKAGKRSGKPPARKGRRSLPDPSDHPETTTRFIQPYEATKTYLCPGCQGDILPGQGHLVAVPPDAPDLRRHWHRGCWNGRHDRR